MNHTTMATVTITGTRSLLWDFCGPDTLKPGPATPPRLGDPIEWQQSVLAYKNQLFIPGNEIATCLRRAALYTPQGDKHYQRIVTSAIQVLNQEIMMDLFLLERLFVNQPNNPIYIDNRMQHNPLTGQQVARYRIAARPGWKLEFLLSWEQDLLSQDQILELIRIAGLLVGIGGETAAGLGRFRFEPLTDFELE